MRGYHARRAAGQAKALARGRLRAVAVDGKTSRGARRADGTRVHLLGVAEHGGRLLDHLEVDVKHNETSHFTELLEPVDLDGAVVTFDALHTVRANLDWLVKDNKAHYIAVVKRNQPLLHAQVRALPWRQVTEALRYFAPGDAFLTGAPWPRWPGPLSRGCRRPSSAR